MRRKEFGTLRAVYSESVWRRLQRASILLETDCANYMSGDVRFPLQRHGGQRMRDESSPRIFCRICDEPVSLKSDTVADEDGTAFRGPPRKLKDCASLAGVHCESITLPIADPRSFGWLLETRVFPSLDFLC